MRLAAQDARVKSCGRVVTGNSNFLARSWPSKAIDFKEEKFLLILSDLDDIFGHLHALNVSF